MVPTKQEELTYYALKSHTLKDAEREEIRRKTEEFLKWKHNQIQVIPFGKSGERDAEEAKPRTLKPNEIDITGQRFGNLTAVRRCATRDMASFWVFTCDCGYQGTFERKMVMEGKRVCCDACKEPKVKLTHWRQVDLTGKKFNSLQVVKRTDIVSAAGVIYQCLCDCGASRDVRATNLVHGVTKSCHKCAKKSAKEKRVSHYKARGG